MREIIAASVAGLVGQFPSILTYLVGMILAIVLRRRAPAASVLVLLSAGLLLVIAIIHPFTMQYVLQSHGDWGWTREKLGAVISLLGFGYGVIHAIGIIMLIVAAFIGRPKHTTGS